MTFAIPKASDIESIPIGRPGPNRQAYILDSHGHPVPPGVPGELYLGGAGLARGYLNQPRLTAKRFIPDPFSDKPGARLYRTGDLARYRPDGNVEFLGRIDQQVKIRGFRVELGGVETILSQHPSVRQTVVLAREDTPGDKRLAAYIVPEDGSPSALTGNLRNFVKKKLPDYMVPATFVTLDAMPVTSSGKIDRQALPAPEGERPAMQEAYVAPRTPIEEELSRMWAEVLDVERVGIHDNFFELGGHSLIATQIVSRLRDTFQVELPLRDIFDTPTVAGLATTIAQNLARQEEDETLDQLLEQLDQLSEEEVQAMLANEMGG
jgi:acyl carrier protein